MNNFLGKLKYINENSFMHFLLYGYLALISLSKVLFYEIKYFPFDFKTWKALVWNYLETINSRKTLFWENPLNTTKSFNFLWIFNQDNQFQALVLIFLIFQNLENSGMLHNMVGFNLPNGKSAFDPNSGKTSLMIGNRPNKC